MKQQRSIKDLDSEYSALCTGCMACMDACPAKAITESFTAEGFRIPAVKEGRCVGCGRCVDVCSLQYPKSKRLPIKALSAQAKDDRVLMNCSSGGVFALLACNVIREGGVVIGAAFDQNRRDICHVASDECALEKIYRSKYAQSNTTGIYQKTEKYLRDGRNVLFAGTPCQVRALLLYLKGTQYKGTLRTVDFMCHGVPPTKMFTDFIETREKRQGSEVCNVTFREKDKGWHKQIIKVYFDNGSVWKRTSSGSYYYYLFLNNYTLRDSCYPCDEYQSHSADVTLADHWTASEKSDRGTSQVMVNSEAGHEMIGAVSGEMNAADVSESVIKNMEIYSHRFYHYRNKEKWLKSFRTSGYFGTKTFFFWRVGALQILWSGARAALGRVKRILSMTPCKRREDNTWRV